LGVHGELVFNGSFRARLPLFVNRKTRLIDGMKAGKHNHFAMFTSVIRKPHEKIQQSQTY